MGRQRRQHIKEQVEKIATLINEAPQAIKADANGVVPTPDQLDRLLTLVDKLDKRAARTRTKERV